jgi:hypothetical protein
MSMVILWVVLPSSLSVAMNILELTTECMLRAVRQFDIRELLTLTNT